MTLRTLTAVAVAAATVTVGSTGWAQEQTQVESITFASWGGAYQQAQDQAMIKPAEEKLGINIRNVSHTGLAPIQLQVRTGNVRWELLDLSQTDCQRGANRGLWQKIDYSLIPNAAAVPDEFKSDYWVGLISYGTVLGWNTSTVSDNVPQNWEEFFNTERFPGTRTMRNTARESLEIALLADGVPPDELYPLDVDRAYEKLAEIKSHVTTWWSAGAQSAQLVADGTVDYAALWNGRIAAAIEEGAPADYHWNNSLLQLECLVVPKGLSEAETKAAMKVINVMLAPENQARFATIIPYGPVNPKAFDTGVLTDERAAALPTSPRHIEDAILVSAKFWASEKGERAIARWQRFMQK